MFKRKQKSVSESAKNWYQDKYQRVLVQRNILALVALLALVLAFASVLAVRNFAPLKTVEPFLLQMDEKSGIVRTVEPTSRNALVASEAVDRYFLSRYITARESYNFSILRSNYNLVRVMSTPEVFYVFRKLVDPANPESLAARLKLTGQRDIRFTSISYISNPPLPGGEEEKTPPKIMQARIVATDTIPGMTEDVISRYIVTVTFEYRNLEMSAEDMLLNPLGFQVLNYQIQQEIN
jgi:type IV secretion system protein VirB8